MCALSLFLAGLAAWLFARQTTRRRDGFILMGLRRLSMGAPFNLDEGDPLSAGFADVAGAFQERLRSTLISQEAQLKKAANTELVRVRSQCEGLVEKYAERTHREKKDVEALLDALRADREKEIQERELERQQHQVNVKTLEERLAEARSKLVETEAGLRQEQQRYRETEESLREAHGLSTDGQAQARELREELSLRSSECDRLAAEKEARQAEISRLQSEVARLGGQSVLFFDKVAAQLRGPLQIIDNLVARLGPPEKTGKGPSPSPKSPDGDASMDPAASTGGVGEIRSRLAQLSRLVENILDLCRIQSSELSRVYSEVDVGRLVRRLTADAQVKAKAKEVHVSTVLPARMPSVVMDARYTTRILGEILSNAVRFTPRGGKVTVKVRLVQEGLQGGGGDSRPPAQLHLEVADTGPGIPAEHQERIFAAFERGLDPQFTLSDAGAGLGLTLARHFARMLGGTISLDSKEGQGSTFTVTLPVKVGSAVPAY
jgi:signal transduction histidine kinase